MMINGEIVDAQPHSSPWQAPIPAPPLTDSQLRLDKQRVIEELQAHIVVAGGVRLTDEELRAKPFGELIDMIYPNGIRVAVSSVHYKRSA